MHNLLINDSLAKIIRNGGLNFLTFPDKPLEVQKMIVGQFES